MCIILVYLFFSIVCNKLKKKQTNKQKTKIKQTNNITCYDKMKNKI